MCRIHLMTYVQSEICRFYWGLTSHVPASNEPELVSDVVWGNNLWCHKKCNSYCPDRHITYTGSRKSPKRFSLEMSWGVSPLACTSFKTGMFVQAIWKWACTILVLCFPAPVFQSHIQIKNRLVVNTIQNCR